MSIIIGSARIGENGKITGGAVGDQKQVAKPDMSGEVSMQEFYVHSKGWYVLRAIDDVVGSRLAHAMKRACNNKKIGYNQYQRYGIVTDGVDTKNSVNCDCSSLVRACIRWATGVDVGDFNTSTEAKHLELSGYFHKRIPYDKNTVLYNGDILVTKTKGHTAIVVSGAKRRVK